VCRGLINSKNYKKNKTRLNAFCILSKWTGPIFSAVKVAEPILVEAILKLVPIPQNMYGLYVWWYTVVHIYPLTASKEIRHVLPNSSPLQFIGWRVEFAPDGKLLELARSISQKRFTSCQSQAVKVSQPSTMSTAHHRKGHSGTLISVPISYPLQNIDNNTFTARCSIHPISWDLISVEGHGPCISSFWSGK